MNLILLFEDDFLVEGQRVRLTGRRLEHVRKVHRAELGDQLCVGLEGGAIGTGRITRLCDRALEMDVSLDRPPPAALPVTLILALPRPIVLRRTLIAATSMGVKRIVLLNANRVEKSYWQSSAVQDASIEDQIVLGLEQARDTMMPEVILRTRFRPFVEDELPSLVVGSLGLVADPDSATPCPRAVDRPVVLAVGPEGGWIDFERERFAACGFEDVELGDRILRVETAIPALLSRLF